jgi:hypothetical protein
MSRPTASVQESTSLLLGRNAINAGVSSTQRAEVERALSVAAGDAPAVAVDAGESVGGLSGMIDGASCCHASEGQCT